MRSKRLLIVLVLLGVFALAYLGGDARAASVIAARPAQATLAATDAELPAGATVTAPTRAPVGPSQGGKINPPTTLDDLLKQYPDLQPYIQKVSNTKLGDMDFSEFYSKIAEIYKDKGAAGVGVFLQHSGLLDKLGIPLGYLDLFEAYDKGGMDEVIKQARARKIINDKDELGGFLELDSKDSQDAVKGDLTKLGVSTYEYADASDELRIGIPLEVLSQFQTPGAVIGFLAKIVTIQHVVAFRAPTPAIVPKTAATPAK